MAVNAPRRLIIHAYGPTQGIVNVADPAEISDILDSEGHLVWIDITEPTAEDRNLLREEMHIHSLALEEVAAKHPRPKCAEYPGFYMMVMYAADFLDDGEVSLREVVIYLGRNYLATLHFEAFPEIDECIARWKANTALQNGTIAAPTYSLLDTLVDSYFPVIDRVAEEAEETENRLFADGDNESAGPNLFTLKKNLLQLRRAVGGQRDAMNVMLRQDVPLFPESSLIYFQNVYDHLVRLVESIDTYRDLLSSAMDMHLSVLSNKMNSIMKTLTVISTILMTSSLLAGIYGMNFTYMPELHARYGYYILLSAMVLVSCLLVILFRRLKWF